MVFSFWAFASCISLILNLITDSNRFLFHIFYNEQQAVIEKFNLCEDNLSGLLKWIGQIEQKIASVGGPKEYIDELRNQINLLKVKFTIKILCFKLNFIEKSFSNIN